MNVFLIRGTRWLPVLTACVVATWSSISPAVQPRELVGHDDAVYDVAFSPDGLVLASSSYDKTIKLWNIVDGSVIATLAGHQDQVFRIAFSSDGKSLASCSGDGTAIVWNVATGEQQQVLESHRDPILDVAYSPDGSLIATAGAHIQLWKDGREIWSTPHSEWFFAIAFSPDQRSLACGTRDLIQIHAIDQADRRDSLNHQKGMTYQVEYSRDGKWLVSATSDGSLSLWDVPSGKLARSVIADNSALFAAAFSLDGNYLVTGGRERVVRTWSVPELKLASELDGPQETVLAVTFSPDGKTIVSGSYDGTIHVWTRGN